MASLTPHRKGKAPQGRLDLVPCTLAAANAFVSRHHRHHGPVTGHKVSVGVADTAGRIRGVAILSRPVARHLDDGWTLEVTRVATDSFPNACSAPYGGCRRVAFALGYQRIITYTLPEESGASLRAAGWHLHGRVGGGRWARATRPRSDRHPLGPKLRWEVRRRRRPSFVLRLTKPI